MSYDITDISLGKFPSRKAFGDSRPNINSAELRKDISFGNWNKNTIKSREDGYSTPMISDEGTINSSKKESSFHELLPINFTLGIKGKKNPKI